MREAIEDRFIPTQNFQKFQSLCADLLKTTLGLEMGAVIGSTGRGKTTAGERIVTMSRNVVMVRYQNRFSPAGLIREIAFKLGGERPRSTDRCFEIIKEELAIWRRVILVDEADRMSLKHVETMRDIHDVVKIPVVLVGEESLGALLERERRIKRRIAYRLHFEPISAQEIVAFYKKAMNLDLSPKQAARLSKHTEGDFRMVTNDAIQIERMMSVSGIDAVTDELIGEVCNDNGCQGA